MNASEKRIAQLITQYIKGTLTDIERTELDQWLDQPGNRTLFDKITDKQNIINKSIRYDSYNVEAAWKTHRSRLSGQLAVKRRWISYAAAILLPLTVLASIWLITQMANKQEVAEHQILPGKSNAMIYFADGDMVSLDADTMSVIVKQNMEIKKIDGKLIIHSRLPKANIIEQIKLNKIVTARGNEMEIVLPDGSHAWLNADSYLEFPSVFDAKERRIKTKGEVYFDIAKDELKPFIVETGQMALKVLGTQFNVRHYPEEKHIVSTLVEGKVEISNSMDDNIVLIPGQSASLDKQTAEIQVQEVDVKSVIAWKEGRFYFENQSLEMIMNELSRWYDFDFSFENEAMKNERFSVDVPRFENANKILSKIEGTNVLAIEITKEKVLIKNQK